MAGESRKVEHAKLVLLISLVFGFSILSAFLVRAEEICIYFFYNERCPTCPAALPYSLSFWVITGAALADSINPCAIAILLFLLGSLALIKEAKKYTELASRS
ncbi:MAG: hypothetical protein AOA66_0037 [Candidatus Bathyarchaeota archaeon BA2]|nr:MAG: hypothetical protein AOA66_0037 [Candidatus Bathyarchaeota archaeon BA2]